MEAAPVMVWFRGGGVTGGFGGASGTRWLELCGGRGGGAARRCDEEEGLRHCVGDEAAAL